MKTLTTTFTLSAVLFLSSYNNFAEIDCATPLTPFLFEFIEASSGENLISNGLVSANNLSSIDQRSQQLLVLH